MAMTYDVALDIVATQWSEDEFLDILRKVSPRELFGLSWETLAAYSRRVKTLSIAAYKKWDDAGKKYGWYSGRCQGKLIRLHFLRSVGYELDNAMKARWAASLGVTETTGRTCIGRLFGTVCKPDHEHLHAPPVAYSASLWNRDGKPYMYVTHQPHWGKWHEGETRKFCDRLGLQYSIHANGSWQSPGEEYLVTYTMI